MTTRRRVLGAAGLLLLPPAWAHHGWSSFDTRRPLYLEGRAAQVSWRNPHAEFTLEVDPGLRLPADLKQRALPAQASPVDATAMLGQARLPGTVHRSWKIELAPLSRLQAWKMEPIKPGDAVAVLGYGLAGERPEPLIRAEYVWTNGQVYALRSSPA
jgi:hypothetical protein